jgi:hypothetical protein
MDSVGAQAGRVLDMRWLTPCRPPLSLGPEVTNGQHPYVHTFALSLMPGLGPPTARADKSGQKGLGGKTDSRGCYCFRWIPTSGENLLPIYVSR